MGCHIDPSGPCGPPSPVPPLQCLPGMRGDGMRGAVGRTCIQCVSFCHVVWFLGPGAAVRGPHLFIRSFPPTRAGPLQGRTMNSWFAVVVGTWNCSTSRFEHGRTMNSWFAVVVGTWNCSTSRFEHDWNTNLSTHTDIRHIQKRNTYTHSHPNTLGVLRESVPVSLIDLRDPDPDRTLMK